jgi:hypothetical protein
MIIKIQPDFQKAKSLEQSAELKLERLNKTDKEKYPADTLKDYYDIIHKLMEAITLSKGIKTKGDGAHQELIDYIAKEYTLGEKTRIFLQQIRDYRNRISYEGFNVTVDYIETNNEEITRIISALKSILKNPKK